MGQSIMCVVVGLLSTLFSVARGVVAIHAAATMANSPSAVHSIVSGGQTGADRGALDFARAARIPYRGWVHQGRTDELGPIPAEHASLIESDSPDPAVRIRLNVKDSDGTVILTWAAPVGGSAVTAAAATDPGRPWVHLDLSSLDDGQAAEMLREWVREKEIRVLNVAGSRQSEDGEAYARTKRVLE